MLFRWVKPVLVLSFLFISFNAIAQEQDIYAVNDVVIKASGKSPSDARTKAISDGQRSALTTLFQRLGKDQSLVSNLNDEQIDDMVSSKQIVDEKIAGSNYSATLNLSFSESFVKYYIGGDKAVVSKEPESKEEIYLIVPVKVVKDQMVVWGEDNDWKVAFDNVIKNSKSAKIKYAKGDDQDVSVLNPENVSDPEFTKFEDLISKYKATSIIFAYFDFDNIENKVNIALKTVNKYKIEKVRLDFLNVNQLTMSDLVSKVASKTFDYIVGNKNDSASVAASVLNIDFDVVIRDLGEWLTIKSRLENNNIISGLKVESISQDVVKIKGNYDGKNGEMISFFAKNNLYLQKKPEGGFFLSLTNLNPQINKSIAQ